MPFGPECEYADMADCIRKNQDKDDPEAWCAQVMRETEGKCAGNMTETRVMARRKTARPVARNGDGSWYRIVHNKKDSTAELWIYDEISWWGVTAQELVDELREIDASNIDVHLNSPGGDVFDGIAIYTALREHKAQIHMRIDALAASVASVIAMAGDHISITKPGSMMIHDAWGLAIGNATDMRAMAEILDTQSDIIAQVYADRAGGTRDEWRTRMKDESWFDSAEALEVGLVDEIRGDEIPEDAAAATDRWDLSVFNYAGRAKAPAPVIRPVGPEGGGDWWSDLPDAAFAGVGTALKDATTDPFLLDPDVVRSAITERTEDAPAVPTVQPRDFTDPPDHVDIDTFGRVLWEALQ